MVANLGKFQIMFLGSKIDNNNIKFIVEDKILQRKNEVKLLGIIIDDKLTFTKHINNLCNLASNRLKALTRIRKYLSTEQTKHLAEAYIMSTFNCCSLKWMFCNKPSNSLINNIHKCTLRLIFERKDASFEDLLLRDKSRIIHQENIHTLMVEIYKSINHISPPIH